MLLTPGAAGNFKHHADDHLLITQNQKYDFTRLEPSRKQFPFLINQTVEDYEVIRRSYAGSLYAA